jgi:hypothetical protein
MVRSMPARSDLLSVDEESRLCHPSQACRRHYTRCVHEAFARPKANWTSVFRKLFGRSDYRVILCFTLDTLVARLPAYAFVNGLSAIERRSRYRVSVRPSQTRSQAKLGGHATVFTPSR